MPPTDNNTPPTDPNAAPQAPVTPSVEPEKGGFFAKLAGLFGHKPEVRPEDAVPSAPQAAGESPAPTAQPAQPAESTAAPSEPQSPQTEEENASNTEGETTSPPVEVPPSVKAPTEGAYEDTPPTLPTEPPAGAGSTEDASNPDETEEESDIQGPGQQPPVSL